jgi:AraC-like DNA-binding protein
VQLEELIRKQVGGRELVETAVPGLTLVSRTKPVAMSCVTYEPSVAVIARGSKRVELGQRTFVYDEKSYLLTSVDLPISSQLLGVSEKNPFVGMALKLDMELVREMTTHVERRERGGATGMAVAKTTPELIDACTRLVALLDRPEDIGVMAGLIQREIVYRVLMGEEGERMRAIATAGEQSQRTAKAVSWLKENYNKPLRVEELAQMAGMGLSTFHHHFRALTEMSPLQYQKQLRLQMARRLMLAEGYDAAGAAFAVGYESASQFSREYARFFGQPPKRDIQMLRSA